MKLPGFYQGAKPCVFAVVRGGNSLHSFSGYVRFVIDTAAVRTTLLDADARRLRIPEELLNPRDKLVGLGGAVRTFLIDKAELIFESADEDFSVSMAICVTRHDLDGMPTDDRAKVAALASVLGLDFINKFKLLCEYRKDVVRME